MEKTGHFTFTNTSTLTQTLTETYLGPNDKIRFKLISSNDPQYSETDAGTVLYRENATTISGYEPVSSEEVTSPANGWTGEDISLHVEINCLHRGS